jgi:hypothetical protein
MESTNIKKSSALPEKDKKFFELEKAKFIIKDATNLDVAYAYEDLVFSEHGIFILQFHKQLPNTFLCWFNKDCVETERYAMFKSLTTSANLNQLKIVYKGKFEMSQPDSDQEISIKFTKALLYAHSS